MRLSLHSGRTWLALAAIACSVAAQAQPQGQPTADEERRSQERERTRREGLQRTPDAIQPGVPRPQHSYPSAESQCQPVRSIALDGQDAARFAWALDSVVTGADAAVGKCLGVAGIQAVAHRVQSTITDQGFVTTRVLVRTQDLSGGHLSLTVLPGRIRRIVMAEPQQFRANAGNALASKPGDILNLRDIEQALENLKRVPTVQAEIRIEPAEAANQSDIVIDWKQRLPLRVSATLDDSGSRSTGKYQASLTLSYDHWLTLNDLFYVTASHDAGGGQSGERGTAGHTVHYSLPWGYWLLGFTASRSSYRQAVAGATQDYLYKGTSESRDVRLSRVVYRSASAKTTAGVKAWLRRSRNFIDDTEIEAQRRATGGWEALLAHRQYLGEVLADMSLSHKRGTGAFTSLQSPEELFGEGTSRMRLTQAEVAVSAPLRVSDLKLRYTGVWRAQWDRTPLTPQDGFALGGRYTVRGFDGETSLLAERGRLIRNDLALAIATCGCETYLGLDYGEVRGPSAASLAGQHLAGAVMGLRGSLGSVGYDLFAGKPLSRPASFRTASSVAGFSLQVSF